MTIIIGMANAGGACGGQKNHGPCQEVLHHGGTIEALHHGRTRRVHHPCHLIGNNQQAAGGRIAVGSVRIPCNRGIIRVGDKCVDLYYSSEFIFLSHIDYSRIVKERNTKHFSTQID